MCKWGNAILGVAVAIAKPCRYAIIPTAKNRPKNRLNVMRERRERLLYAAALKPERRLIAINSNVKNKT